MKRIGLGLIVGACFVVMPCVAARAQVAIYPALPQPPAASAYSLAFPAMYQGPLGTGIGPYGVAGFGLGGGYGVGGYGFGGYGFGGYGWGGNVFGARGYYPPNPFGNMNWLPPNPPSPYYVVPSRGEYLEQVRRKDEAVYTELLLRHNGQK